MVKLFLKKKLLIYRKIKFSIMYKKISREVKLSLTAIAAIIILIWGINFLKGRVFFEKNNMYQSVYDNVAGLKTSSSVIYRGYDVGKVISIEFTGARLEKVLVKYSVKNNLRLPKDSKAIIENSDLMGTKAINIVAGDSDIYAQNGDVIKGVESMGVFAQLNKEIIPIKNRALRLMASFDSVMILTKTLFNNKTKSNINVSIENIKLTLQNLKETSGKLNKLLIDNSTSFSNIIRNIDNVTTTLDSNKHTIEQGIKSFKRIGDEIEGANIQEMAHKVDRMLSRLDSIVAKVDRGEGSLGSILENRELYNNINQVALSLNHLIVEVKNNPKRFVHFSMFDFSGNKNKLKNKFGVSIYSTYSKLDITDDIYRKNKGVFEVVRNGRYYYIIKTFTKIEKAQRYMNNLRVKYPASEIVFFE